MDRATPQPAPAPVALVALGSNRRHGRHGRPEQVLLAAMQALEAAGLVLEARSRLWPTAPLGPGGRRFANAVVAVRGEADPVRLLRLIKRIESDFGRRRGQRWGDRVLDLDIIGIGPLVLRRKGLQVPHPRMAERRFVLDPLVEVAPGWRHPLLGVTARQLRARAMRPMARAHIA